VQNSQCLSLRMKKAGFPIEKTIEGFEFDFQPSIERSMINGLATLKFIANCENIVFLGPPGVERHIWRWLWAFKPKGRVQGIFCQCRRANRAPGRGEKAGEVGGKYQEVG